MMTMSRQMRRGLWLVAIAWGLLALVQPAMAQDDGHVLVLTLEGVINPPAASYVERGIEQAETSGATVVILEIDTPGGLDSSTRDIVQAIDNAGVPVILYVAPQGARAASAGTYIAMASHLIAMAPGTTIGSATPVAIGSEGDVQDLPEDLRNKVVNEAVSYIRAHAEDRGRNADWAEKAVREGANLPANDAVEQNVVELVARDLEELLQAADGIDVTLGSGETVTIRTAGLPVVHEGMSLLERFLQTVTDPNIALILLSIGVIGLMVEVSNPGLVFPGVTGVVFLVLGFYGLGTLNASWGGIGLVLLGFGLVIAEAFTSTFGLLALGGVILLVLGGSLLFIDAPPGVELSPWTLAGVVVIGAGVILFFLRAIVRSRRSDLMPLGYGMLIGATGTARTPLDPEGTVFVHGERWHAHALDGEIDEGTDVFVEQAEGSDIWVRRIPEEK